MKKEWKRPQLQILILGRFEERILENCKGATGDGPLWTHLRCRTFVGEWCNQYCSVQSDS